MVVYSSDGERLGKIASCQSNDFTVEKGLLLPKVTQFRYDDVSDVVNGVVNLKHPRSSFADGSFWNQGAQSPPASSTASTATGLGASATGVGSSTTAGLGAQKSSGLSTDLGKDWSARSQSDGGTWRRDDKDELNVQLAEEEITIDKVKRDFGEVRIHKRVVVTHKQITVPVMHEEVVVEHVPAQGSAKLATDAFTESRFAVPLHEEEVAVHKHGKVREEVHLKRRPLQEERTAQADLRREELDIDQPKYAARSSAIPILDDSLSGTRH
jgi:uncharacterized protein (TIGR02271 family)